MWEGDSRKECPKKGLNVGRGGRVSGGRPWVPAEGESIGEG